MKPNKIQQLVLDSKAKHIQMLCYAGGGHSYGLHLKALKWLSEAPNRKCAYVTKNGCYLDTDYLPVEYESKINIVSCFPEYILPNGSVLFPCSFKQVERIKDKVAFVFDEFVKGSNFHTPNNKVDTVLKTAFDKVAEDGFIVTIGYGTHRIVEVTYVS